ncbi:MAG: DUF4358 domain-containing protein [Cellulosilyticaceae bacterium]
MKKILTLLSTALLAAVLLVACGSPATTGPKDIVVPELVSAMVENGYIPMPMEIDAAAAQEMYLINPDNVTEYAIAKTGRSPGIGLIVIAEAKEGKVEEVKTAMEQLLKQEVGNAFYPDEVDAAQQAEIMVDGPYVSLFILNPEVKDEAIAMYKDAING